MHNQYYLQLQATTDIKKQPFSQDLGTSNIFLTYAALFCFTEGEIFTRFEHTCEMYTHYLTSFMGDCFGRMTDFSR